MDYKTVELQPQMKIQPTPVNGHEKTQKKSILSIGLFITNLIWLTFLVMGIVSLVGAALFSLARGQSISQITSLFSIACANAGIILLILPSTLCEFGRLIGRPQWEALFKINPFWIIPAFILFPLILGAGSLLTFNESPFNLIASPFNFLIVGIPVGIIFELSTRFLQRGSTRHSWGLLSFGLTITPLVISLLEIGLIIIIIGLAVAVVLGNNPDAQIVLNRLMLRISFVGMNTEGILRIFQPAIRNPFTIYIILAIMSGFVPLLEEMLKPLGCWFLLSRRLTPQEGFSSGIICGLAFTFIESTNAMVMVMNSSWGLAAMMRIGTGLVHMAATGLIGWALASSISDGRYFRLILSYLLSVFIHGLWNFFTALMVLNPFLENDSFLKSIGFVSPVGLLILMISMGLLLFGGNRILRKQNSPA